MNDDVFLRAFEACSLPAELWTHQAHVRVAFLYLTRFELSEAIDRVRIGIKAYNSFRGVVDGPSSGYHETTTLAFMHLIHQTLHQRGPFENFDRFCERHSELLDPRVLLCYYTRDRMIGAQARSTFVPPDIAPLDQVGLAYPEFGKKITASSYTVRPGVYAVIADEAQRIAAVVTRTATHLPGGAQETGEAAIDALKLAVHQVCELTIEVGRPIGVADEFLSPAENGQQVCSRSSFYFAHVRSNGSPVKADRQLIWLQPAEAMAKLTHKSHRWAVTRISTVSDRGTGKSAPRSEPRRLLRNEDTLS